MGQDLVQDVQKAMEAGLSLTEKQQLEGLINSKVPYFVFPVDDLKTGSDEHQAEILAELRVRAVVLILSGKAISYKSENEGELIRYVTPLHENQIGSQGEKFLPLHTDMAYLRFPGEDKHRLKTCAPDFLVLSCVRNDEKVPTSILTLSCITNEIQNTALDLYNSCFNFSSPDSVMPAQNVSDVPILFGHEKYGDMIRWEKCSCSVSIQGFADLSQAVKRSELYENVTLEPGQTLVFNNRMILHGRPAIKRVEGEIRRRLMIRIYVNRADTPSNPVPSGPLHLQDG